VSFTSSSLSFLFSPSLPDALPIFSFPCLPFALLLLCTCLFLGFFSLFLAFPHLASAAFFLFCDISSFIAILLSSDSLQNTSPSELNNPNSLMQSCTNSSLSLELQCICIASALKVYLPCIF